MRNFTGMRHFVFRWAITTIAVMVASSIIGGIRYDTVAALIGAALTRVVPGRFGYWLDLGLIMFALYLCFCAVGSWLRDWVVSRSAPSA